MDDIDRHHPCAVAPTTARCTSALGAKLARARFLANSVKWQYFLHGRWVLSAGAPEEIRTPDPQIRSLGIFFDKPHFFCKPLPPCTIRFQGVAWRLQTDRHETALPIIMNYEQTSVSYDYKIFCRCPTQGFRRIGSY
jgi:hypothetical protein